jgi:uncharacterized C2H2 Zn-finger protein
MSPKEVEEKDGFVPAGYEHCPICDVVVHRDALLGHVRHGGCRLYKARERELIRQGQLNCRCPLCQESVNRKDLRTHLAQAHPA